MSKTSTQKTAEEINQEHEQLINVLKFTPRTYTIQLWGYGGEHVMGTVDRTVYDYFKRRRLNVSDFAWDSDYAEEHNIPEDMWPFPPGSWYECDNMGHCNGVARDAGTLQICDENGNTIVERSLEDFDGYSDDSPQLACGDESWIDSQSSGTVVFIGTSHEKGTFFEGEIYLQQPFDITKLELTYDEIDGNEIISSITYDGEEIENFGGSTSGKSSDFGFFIAGSNKHDGNGWEKYSTMDDIAYKLTGWFPKKVVPSRTGVYNVKTAEGYTYHANWNGVLWENTWGEPPEEIKIKEWQGIAYDPDEHEIREELDKIYLEP